MEENDWKRRTALTSNLLLWRKNHADELPRLLQLGPYVRVLPASWAACEHRLSKAQRQLADICGG